MLFASRSLPLFRRSLRRRKEKDILEGGTTCLLGIVAAFRGIGTFERLLDCTPGLSTYGTYSYPISYRQ